MRDATGKLAHSEYFREYLPPVSGFLFAEAGEAGCRYFQMPKDGIPEALRRDSVAWCRRLDPDESTVGAARKPGSPTPRGIQLLGLGTDRAVWRASAPNTDAAPDGGPLALRISLESNARLELWLSKLGVGVVSLSLVCRPDDERTAEFADAVVELNHALVTGQQAIWFGSPTAAVPSQHLHEWLRQQLRPLTSRAPVDFELRGVAYTALAVAQPGTRDSAFDADLDRRLSHLAQVHPRSHPGEDQDRHARPLKVNRHHRCAIGLGGSAHAALVPVEPSGHYDANRLRRIQMEYFPGFLLAQIQRLCLQQFVSQSAETSRITDQLSGRAHAERLANSVMRFGLEGEFVQACWRETPQRHHELAQQACLVHEGTRTVRSAMSDFAAVSSRQYEREQREASERSAETHRREAAQSERTMQVLEVFIVTFYSVELAHILGEAFGFGHTRFVGWSLILVALGSFGMGSLLVSWKWLKKRRPGWTILALFLMASLIHAAFLGANAWWKVSASQAAPKANATTTTSPGPQPQDGH
ncbi:MAG: hypothetical protein J5I93_05005 [Pirellulaceae bacterium]|nr:hypothetical protein [Pirellulaceae bacterium]